MIALEAAAVEEWKQNQKKLKDEAEAQRKDREFGERLHIEFGYTKEEIEAILNKKQRAEDKEKEPEGTKTTWIKVHRKHLLPETLMAFNLPWKWDASDANYIIIKKWITEDFQEELFAHTRRLREASLSQISEQKVNERKDKIYLVRKKSPNRTIIFDRTQGTFKM